jgi:autotransporter-associated beta strand protein
MVVFANSATAASAVHHQQSKPTTFCRIGYGCQRHNRQQRRFNDISKLGNGCRCQHHDQCRRQLQFQNTSTAGSATITTNGSTSFRDSSSAGNATLVTNDQGVTSFGGSATAGNAVIITNSGGLTSFSGTSTGGQARLINNAGGQVLFFNGTYSVGSIEGAGIFNLLAALLPPRFRWASNNLSTEVSGRIRGSDGGSLIKLGTGTLTLSGSSSLGAGTTVSAGRLIVTGELTSDVAVGSSGTLGGGQHDHRERDQQWHGLAGQFVRLSRHQWQLRSRCGQHAPSPNQPCGTEQFA